MNSEVSGMLFVSRMKSPAPSKMINPMSGLFFSIASTYFLRSGIATDFMLANSTRLSTSGAVIRARHDLKDTRRFFSLARNDAYRSFPSPGLG